MANNRELSQFAKFVSIDESGNNSVGIGTSVIISDGGLVIGSTKVIDSDGTWSGSNSGLVGAQGAQGVQGATGAQGAVGAQGAQGAQGFQGVGGSATITNEADNRVLTATGTAGTINGEENLTFTGSSLRINTTTSSSQLEVNNSASKINIATLKTTAGAGSIAGLGFMVGQTSAGREKAAIYFQETNGGAHYTGDIVFALNNDSGSAVQVDTSDEKVRITSGGNIGIGTDNPQTALVVERDWVNNYGSINIKSSSDVLSGIGFRTDGGYAGGFIYRDGTTGNFFELNAQGSREIRALLNGTERLRIDSDGVSIFGSSGSPSSSNTVSIHPDDGMVNFGMDGRDSFVTGTAACYIYSGSGATGSIPAGTLILQSRSNLNRDIQFVTGQVPTERLRINGSGAFGLSGANYGTSGQVLTSQGSSAAPQWATPSGSTWTWDTSQTTLAGNSSVTVSGIPSTAKKVLVHFYNISNNTNQDWIFRLGNSGGIITSGYQVSTGYMFSGSTNRTNGFHTYATGTASHKWTGFIDCVNIGGTLWYCRMFFNAESDANVHYAVGKVGVTTLDRINFSTYSGTFDDGGIYVSYMEP